MLNNNTIIVQYNVGYTSYTCEEKNSTIRNESQNFTKYVSEYVLEYVSRVQFFCFYYFKCYIIV